MKNERNIIGGLFILQLILWLGFLVHRSPRFPGSLTGGILGVSAALLLVVPSLLYSATKHIESFKQFISKRISMGTILIWHVYTSIIGSILAIIHTGHRFESNLGIWLTTMMMLTVLSGFIGRYFLIYSSKELHEKQDLLNLLAYQYNQIINELSKFPKSEVPNALPSSFLSRALNSFIGVENSQVDAKAPLSLKAIRLVESISDVEYAIKTHELLKKRTAAWLKMHIITACAFYLLLIFHVWSVIYMGLRWLK